MVVLPAPLEPSTVAISPRAHLQADAADRLDRAVGALDVEQLEHGLVAHGWRAIAAHAVPPCAAQRRHVVHRAQVGLDHARVGLHLARRAHGQHLALVHGQHAVGHLGHQRHVVLHHQHRDAELVLDVLDPERHVVGFLHVQARTRARRAAAAWARCTARAPARPPCARRRAGRPPSSRGGAAGPASRSPARPSRAPAISAARVLAREEQLAPEAGLAVRVAADQQVVQHRGVLEQLDVLEGARDAQRGDLVRRLRRSALAPRGSRSRRWSGV